MFRKTDPVFARVIGEWPPLRRNADLDLKGQLSRKAAAIA